MRTHAGRGLARVHHVVGPIYGCRVNCGWGVLLKKGLRELQNLSPGEAVEVIDAIDCRWRVNCVVEVLILLAGAIVSPAGHAAY